MSVHPATRVERGKGSFAMRTRFGCCTFCLVVMLALTTSILAQSSQPSKAPETLSGGSDSDIVGIWMPTLPRRVGGVNDTLLDPADKRKPDSAKVVPFLPEAEARYKAANPLDNTATRCLPPGISFLMLVAYPIAILRAPGRVVLGP